MSTNDSAGLSRRGLFRVGAGAAVAAASASAATPTYAQEEFDYDDWFDDVPNFEGTVDRTGQEEVTVEVGAGDDGLVFEPPAIHVDPGTTVIFQWTGEGGVHNVVEREPEERYESDLVEDAGTTYEVTFESDGISKYVCTPHEGLGMKGAVAVGDGEGTPEISEGEFVVGGTGEPDDADDEAGLADENEEDVITTDSDVLVLYGLAIVFAFLSPLVVIALMARQRNDEEI